MNRFNKSNQFNRKTRKHDQLTNKSNEKVEELKPLDLKLNSLYFMPLGGTGEFGINLNLYHCNGKWILVDLGMSFEELPGSNVILPDINFIKTLKKEDILGLVITHGHEDHIGAIPYLISELKIPIYAGPFTSSLIEKKLVDNKVKADLRTIEVGQEFSLDPFKIKLINVTHSIPESSMVYIKTPLGNIMHTGDWKFDETPVTGDPTDYKSLEIAAKDGILATVCDSTNAMTYGETVSEEEVKNSIDKVLSKVKKNRIVIGCFSSNISRIDSCARLAQKYGRKIALVGRSIHKIKESAYKHGYFAGLELLNEEEGSKINRNEILFICTGSQGETNSGLKRMSENDHPKIGLEEGDTVVVSAKTIIGREKEVSNMLNNFARNNVNVVTYSSETPIHASGHPVRSDLERLYTMLKPKFTIPVHGERLQQNAHAELAKNLGIKPAVISNGDVLEITPSGTKVTHHFPVSKSILDGKAIVPYDGRTILERRWLENGTIFITVIIPQDGKFKLITGFFGICEKDDVLKYKIRQRIKTAILGMSESDKKARKAVVSTIKKTVKYSMFEFRGKDPAVFVHAAIFEDEDKKEGTSETEDDSTDAFE